MFGPETDPLHQLHLSGAPTDATGGHPGRRGDRAPIRRYHRTPLRPQAAAAARCFVIFPARTIRLVEFEERSGASMDEPAADGLPWDR